MSTNEIANRYVALCKEGKNDVCLADSNDAQRRLTGIPIPRSSIAT